MNVQKITVSRWTSPWERDVYDVESFKFPGGELQVRIPGLPRDLGHVQVEARLQSSDDLIQLLLVDEILGRQSSVLGSMCLIVPYFPYARQDRMTQRTEAFSLRRIARLLNETHFNDVTIVDPHSDVTPALLDATVVRQDEVMARHRELVRFLEENRPLLVAPDAGAAKKTYAAAKRFGLDFVTASKVRDTHTGEIAGTNIEDVDRIEGRHVLIVDDICDGGRTFFELGKVIQRHKPLTTNLYVTHGLFSKGLAMMSTIDRFFTTDSFAKDAPIDKTDHQQLHVHTLGFNAQGELA